MTSRWNDGVPFTYGGSGYDPESTNYTNYIFSGDPVVCTGWTELTPDGTDSTPNTPNDRRALMSTGPFTFAPNETITIDIALPWARDYGKKSPLSSLALLKTQINVQLPQGLYIYRAVMQDHSVGTGKIIKN